MDKSCDEAGVPLANYSRTMTEFASSSGMAASVSVAMCTYQGQRYLAEQLESISRQTVLPSELVVCDDQSTDRTVEILEGYARTAPFPVKIHVNESRLGFAQNFARSLSLTSGEVVLLTDQDDRWLPTRVAATEAAFSSNPDLTFTFSDASLMDADGVPLGRTIYSNIPVRRADRRRIEQGSDMGSLILRCGTIYGCTMAVRARYRDTFLPIPSGWSHDEWIALTLSAIGPSARLGPVTEYRQHGAQLAGGERWTLGRHLREARKRGRQEYEAELSRYDNGLAVALRKPKLRASLAPALERKILFLADRQRVREGRADAPLLLIKLLVNGSYRRFSAGLASAVKDASVLLASGFSRYNIS